MSEQPKCSLCGYPMPTGEEMFKYHGYSGPCPKSMSPLQPEADKDVGEYVALLAERDELLAVLKDVELVINPRDIGGISLHEWGSRLRVASSKILAVVAKVEGNN